MQDHYLDDVSERVRDNLVDRLTTKLPIQGSELLGVYDRVNDAKEFTEATLKNYDQMKNSNKYKTENIYDKHG